MWNLNGTKLINKADEWSSNHEWKLKIVHGTKVYIENTTNKTVLGLKDDGSVNEQSLVENKEEQIWEVGIPSKDNFVTLTNIQANKLLTATSAYSLEIKGMYTNISTIPSFSTPSFSTPSLSTP